MRAKARKYSVRRQPTQRRARQTVEAVLDAVVRILKRDGVDTVTTNRIAEVAGVSIGSIYQYFADRKAIFIALHQRHLEQVDRVIARTLLDHAASPLNDLIRAMIDVMVEIHAKDPELYHMMMAEVPHRADGTKDFAVRLHSAFRLAISARSEELKTRRDLDKAAFVVTHIVDALSHGAVLRRPAAVSLSAAKEEAVKAVMAYLNA